MYKTRLQNPQARQAAAECLRIARVSRSYDPRAGEMHRICVGADEVFGFAITIAENLKTADRRDGNFAKANHYRDAARALDRAN